MGGVGAQPRGYPDRENEGAPPSQKLRILRRTRKDTGRFQYWIIKEKQAFSGNEICHADSQSPPRFFGQKNRNFGNFISENDHFKKFSVVSFDFLLVVTTVFFSGFFIGELGFFYWRIPGFFRRQCARQPRNKHHRAKNP